MPLLCGEYADHAEMQGLRWLITRNRPVMIPLPKLSVRPFSRMADIIVGVENRQAVKGAQAHKAAGLDSISSHHLKNMS